MAVIEAKILVLAVFLATHCIASWKKWYYKRPEIDMITHFFGGLAVGAFIKDWAIAIALIIGWEFLEMLLISSRWKAFRETPLNRVRDVLCGFLGYFIAVNMI